MKVYPSLRQLIQKEKEFKKKARNHGLTVNVVSGWADEKKVSISDYHYCHASMDKRYHDTIDTPKVLFSQVQDNVVDWGHIRPYFEWLFNYSPYAPCFITKGAKRALNERVIALDPNQPANLIGGALIASRLGTERYTAAHRIAGKLIMWHRLVELGVHPSLAFTLSHVPSMSKIEGDDLNIKNIKEINWQYHPVGHEAISPGEDVYLAEHGGLNGVATHQNFFNNNQVGVDKDSFAKKGSRNKSSFLWIGSKSYPNLFNVNRFVGDALKEAFHKSGIKKSGNPFAAAKNKSIDNTKLAPFQEAMEVIAGLSPKIVKELECAK